MSTHTIADSDTLSQLKELLSNDQNTDHITDKLLSILGGINFILRDYIAHNKLNESQIICIYQLLRTNPNKLNNTSHNAIKLATFNSQHSLETPHIQNVLILDERNTTLNILCNERLSKIITKLCTNIMTKLITCIVFMIQVILQFGTQFDKISQMFSIITTSVVYIPLLIYLHLSMNRTAMKRILESFEYWFKMYYVIIYKICDLMIEIIVYGNRQITSHQISDVFTFVLWLVFLSAVALLDGIKGHSRFKMIVSAGCGLFLLWKSIKYELLSYEDDGSDKSMINIVGGIQLSLISTAASATRIVSIFMFKQCILVMYYYCKHENKATFIRTSVTLKWNSNVHKDSAISQKKQNTMDKTATIGGEDEDDSFIHIETRNMRQKHQNSASFSINSPHPDLD